MVEILTANGGNAGSIPGSRRSSGETDGNLLLYFCLGNPPDRGSWQAIVHGAAKESDATLQPNNKNNIPYVPQLLYPFTCQWTSRLLP